MSCLGHVLMVVYMLRFSWLSLLVVCEGSFFLYNVTTPTEIYTLSLHDALPILVSPRPTSLISGEISWLADTCGNPSSRADRKSTRLNSSHDQISYAVFCLKKKI